jgi:hypothetical protein
MTNLKKLNWAAAIAQGVTGLGILIYFLVKKGDINYNTALYQYDIDEDQNDPANSKVIASMVWDVSGTFMKALVVIYFLFTCFFHVFYATDGFGTGAYSRALMNQNNYFRWIEYAISSTIMTFLILIICGVKDFDLVIFAIIINIAMILCGQIAESAKEKKVKYVALAVGFICLLGLSYVILRTFFTRLSQANKYGFKIPGYVYAIVFPLVLWYISFGIVSLVQAIKGNPNNPMDYIKYEKWYIYLSFLSKLNLGVFVAFGLTRPKDQKE